jgi:hypothetical protein
MEEKKVIRSFLDLEVYNNAYKAMLIVYKEIIPKLPNMVIYYHNHGKNDFFS